MKEILQSSVLKYTVVFLTMPLWLPFLKALWEDINESLREDGGLLGQPPSPEMLKRMRWERRNEPDLMVSEPQVKRGQRGRPSMTKATSIPGASWSAKKSQSKNVRLRGGER